jgi:hypothetical protein
MKITKEEIEELQNNKMIQDITDILVAHMMDVKEPKYGALIPTEDGWICPCGKYKQEYR